jgi:N-ethylmaleimide reductase
VPRPLETEEITGIVEDYRNAARKAKAAGFDGVEVHSANCYLLEQFLRDSTNKRTDRYGGSVENRARLSIEVCAAVSDIWGPGRVGIRLSPITHAVGQTPLDSNPRETYGYLAQQLGKLRLAYLHCIEGQTRGVVNEAGAFDFKALHTSFGGKYIANNSYTRTLAISAIETGHADMIAFGRPFIGNPDLVERLRRDAPLVDASPSIYYGGSGEGYVDFKPLEAAVA